MAVIAVIAEAGAAGVVGAVAAAEAAGVIYDVAVTVVARRGVFDIAIEKFTAWIVRIAGIAEVMQPPGAEAVATRSAFGITLKAADIEVVGVVDVEKER